MNLALTCLIQKRDGIITLRVLIAKIDLEKQKEKKQKLSCKMPKFGQE